ncbi:MAG TPA: ATP-binding protein [Bacteroidales bacterium]|nr:ATP-binding protein [Bacteroidales bacterium]
MQGWKWLLLFFALLIVAVSLYFTDTIVKRIAADERQRVILWADAVQQRASLVNYTERFFEEIKYEERKRVDLWAMANRRIMEMPLSANIDIIYVEIITSNTTIPILITDNEGNVLDHRNLDPKFGDPAYFTDELKGHFSEYPPIHITSEMVPGFETQYLYYRDSRVFTELRELLDDFIHSFISEVVVNSANVPVIIVDSAHTRIIAAGNVDVPAESDSNAIAQVIGSLAGKNPPIVIQLPGFGTSHVLYANSFLLTQLRYYPVVQFAVIGIFLLVAYILFSTARRAEQNHVWVGMSKETAHQLGTPISSLVGWLEIIRMKGVEGDTLREISKDIRRLENITERFSKIGSPAKLEPVNVVDATRDAIGYMKNRTSKKVSSHFNSSSGEIIVPLNINLFEWVIENIWKNAVDAINGSGTISIQIEERPRQVIVDISDTGKGIQPGFHKAIFNPGFTSKQKGWGLGLSLCKRIIENYHRGRLFVKKSEINKGTTFRIVLNKQLTT